MSKKKKRQRGSRTHGTGSQKNHRGAGNRGGRGAAGRKDHEKQLHGPLGKAGFTRPEDATLDVETVNARELDEDVPLLLSAGDAEETDDGIAVDARDVVDDGHEVDAVKLLGEETTLQEAGLAPALRLHPPRGGHEGIKKPTVGGGQLGTHTTEEIDSLLEAMR